MAVMGLNVKVSVFGVDSPHKAALLLEEHLNEHFAFDLIHVSDTEGNSLMDGVGGVCTTTEGDVYLIHFERKFGHAQHYLGFAPPGRLEDRLNQHRKNHKHGAKLIQHVNAAGIGWEVVRVWRGGGRVLERTLKNRGGSARHCPICKGEQSLTVAA